MSITDYASLQSSVASWLARDSLTSVIPDHIALFEARFQRQKRVRQMETHASLTISSQRTALPAGYLEMRALVLQTNPLARLELVTPDFLWSHYAGSETGQPTAFSIIGGEIVVGPVPDASYTADIDYYSFAPLSASNTTNWLLTQYPDIYLFGTLVESFAYIRNIDGMTVAKARLDEALAELADDDQRARWSGSPLVMRPSGSTP
jgi:hypothetical protein